MAENEIKKLAIIDRQGKTHRIFIKKIKGYRHPKPNPNWEHYGKLVELRIAKVIK